MSVERFLTPRLVGTRFEGRAVPLEFLKELSVLEEMIIEVAKRKYLDQHPDRKRALKGFTDGIEFKLTNLEDGSATLVISLVIASLNLFPPAKLQYFTDARAAFGNAIYAAQTNAPITGYLPESSLSYFDRIGRSLKENEAIEFPIPELQHTPRLTKESRKKLVLASAKKIDFTEDISIRGIIPEVDQERMSFHLITMDGKKLPACIPTEHMDTIIQAFNGYTSGVRVHIQGIGSFSRQDKLNSIESIEHISLLDPLDIAARLDELRNLTDGWLDSEGIAPTHDGLDWLTQAFNQHLTDDDPLPYIYPVVDGGILAEWLRDANDASLEIDINQRQGFWHYINLTLKQSENRHLDLQSESDWSWLITRIREIGG